MFKFIERTEIISQLLTSISADHFKLYPNSTTQMAWKNIEATSQCTDVPQMCEAIESKSLWDRPSVSLEQLIKK